MAAAVDREEIDARAKANIHRAARMYLSELTAASAPIKTDDAIKWAQEGLSVSERLLSMLTPGMTRDLEQALLQQTLVLQLRSFVSLAENEHGGIDAAARRAIDSIRSLCDAFSRLKNSLLRQQEGLLKHRIDTAAEARDSTILSLADIFEEMTGIRASYRGDTRDSELISPFTRFVASFFQSIPQNDKAKSEEKIVSDWVKRALRPAGRNKGGGDA